MLIVNRELMPTMLNHWDRRMLGLAKHVSSWSKDPSTKVGAIICDPLYRVVSVGFNGFPRGVTDSLERLGDRDVKYRMIVHAERNAMLFANKPLNGCSLYVWPFMPCAACAAMIIQAGIVKVYAPDQELGNVRWSEDFTWAMKMFGESDVELVIMRFSDGDGSSSGDGNDNTKT